jgi:hypothetical protein
MQSTVVFESLLFPLKIQTSFTSAGFFYSMYNQSSFVLPVLLYLIGKVASKVFRKVYKIELKLLLVSLSF